MSRNKLQSLEGIVFQGSLERAGVRRSEAISSINKGFAMLVRFALVMCGLVMFVGCNGSGSAAPKPAGGSSSHGHDHGHEHGAELSPADFAKSLTDLKSLADNILKAGSENKIDDAHDDLHTIGDLLGSIEANLVKQKLPEAKLASAQKAAAALFTAFGSIDETMHDESKTVDFSKLKPEIEKALSDLMEAAK